MPLASAEVFQKMKDGIGKHGPNIVPKVQSVDAVEIRAKKGDKPTIWTVDLKNGSGKVVDGPIAGTKADATFIMLDADFVKLTLGKLKPQEAFMQGKMKIKGNLKAAMKFKADMIPADAKM